MFDDTFTTQDRLQEILKAVVNQMLGELKI